MVYELSRDILYSFVLRIRTLQPAFDRGRPLAGEIEFPHQGAAVLHHDALADSHQLNRFSAECPADIPLAILQA